MPAKTLYISDLDGTLYNPRQEITNYTASIISSGIEKGRLFTIASARMLFDCDQRLAALYLNHPAVLANGALIYDFGSGSYRSVEAISAGAVAPIIDAFEANGLSCFVYTRAESIINFYYGDTALERETQNYYTMRALECCGEVKYSPSLAQTVAASEVIYITLSATPEALEPVRAKLERIAGISYACFVDVYHPSLNCLEIFSAQANKKNGVVKLKALFDCDEIVVFGDNLNDLPMFEFSDRCYATGNALEEVKARATGVLDDNAHDGVAKFLKDEWGL